MFTWCIIVGHKTKPPKSKLKRIVARNAAKKHLFAPLSSPHISSSSFSFMPLFFGSHSSCCLHLLPMPSFSFTFSLSLNIPLLLRDTLPGEPLICFLWSASVFRDALSIAASLSHQPSVSLDFGSLPKHFFFFFRSPSVLCYRALVLCRPCLRCCSVSMQAHASLTGCWQGEAAAVCVR